MKVAVVSSAIWPARAGSYGSEAQLGLLARALQKRGHEVSFLAGVGSDRTGVAKFRVVPITYGSGNGILRAEGNQYEWYREELLEQDFIIDSSGTHRVTESIYFWDRFEFKGKIAWVNNGNRWRSPRPPVVSHYHGVSYTEAHKRAGLEGFGGSAMGPKPGNIHVIPYGVDLETFHPSTVNPAYFLFLSRPHPHKGIYEFVKLAKDHPEEQFVMAWDEAAEDHKVHGQEARRQAGELPNLRYVPLDGDQKLKAELYRGAKALVLPLDPGYVEAFGLCNAEALASGVPVITANHGSPPEIFEPRTAFMVDAAAETAHYKYGQALKRVGELDRAACRQLAEKRFSPELWAQRWETLYEELPEVKP